MNTILLAMLLGALGGLVRSCIGLLKVISVKREIVWKYFWLTTVVSIVIGVFTGTIFTFSPSVSLLSGYAGTDVLDGIYKTYAAQKVLMVKQDSS